MFRRSGEEPSAKALLARWQNKTRVDTEVLGGDCTRGAAEGQCVCELASDRTYRSSSEQWGGGQATPEDDDDVEVAVEDVCEGWIDDEDDDASLPEDAGLGVGAQRCGAALLGRLAVVGAESLREGAVAEMR